METPIGRRFIAALLVAPTDVAKTVAIVVKTLESIGFRFMPFSNHWKNGHIACLLSENGKEKRKSIKKFSKWQTVVAIASAKIAQSENSIPSKR